MKKMINRNYIYLFFFNLLYSYAFFMVTMDLIDKLIINIPSHVGLGLFGVLGFNKYSLIIKKNGQKNIWFIIFMFVCITIMYIALFNFYHYDFMREKNVWWFVPVFIVLGFGELNYYFTDYNTLKKEQNLRVR